MFVYSKLANGITFVEYEKSDKERGVNMPLRIVAILGGAGVSDKVTKTIKPYAETEITKEDSDFLKTNKSFIDFCTQGMMLLSSKQLKSNEVLSALSNLDDGCSPLDDNKIRSGSASSFGVSDQMKLDVKTIDNEL